MSNPTTAQRGLTPDEYNALLHSIWRLQRVIKETEEFADIGILTEETTMLKLRRDLAALERLFVRM